MEIKEYASLKKIQDQLLIDQGRKPTRKGNKSLKRINKSIQKFNNIKLK